jgi:uncharacterized protein (TIGR00369 family)
MSIGCPFFDQLPHRRIETQDGVAVELDLIDSLRGPGGSLHGGAIATLIDVAGASAVALRSGRLVATSSSAVSYLSAGRVGPIRAEAVVLRLSKNHGVADVRVYDVGKERRLVAAAHLTLSFLPGDSFEARTT